MIIGGNQMDSLFLLTQNSGKILLTNRKGTRLPYERNLRFYG